MKKLAIYCGFNKIHHKCWHVSELTSANKVDSKARVAAVARKACAAKSSLSKNSGGEHGSAQPGTPPSQVRASSDRISGATQFSEMLNRSGSGCWDHRGKEKDNLLCWEELVIPSSTLSHFTTLGGVMVGGSSPSLRGMRFKPRPSHTKKTSKMVRPASFLV